MQTRRWKRRCSLFAHGGTKRAIVVERLVTWDDRTARGHGNIATEIVMQVVATMKK